MSTEKVPTLKYSETFDNNYLYIGSVDNHNFMRHDGGKEYQVGLYNTWITHRWSIRVFAFFIACTEVNSFFCLKYFLKNYEEFKVFRLKLAYILIHNYFDRVQDSYEEQEFWVTRLDWVGNQLNQFEMFEEHENCLSRWKKCCSK